MIQSIIRQVSHKDTLQSSEIIFHWVVGTPISIYKIFLLVEVTFWPDLERFQMKKLSDDMVEFMTKRVYDVAMAVYSAQGEGFGAGRQAELLRARSRLYRRRFLQVFKF